MSEKSEEDLLPHHIQQSTCTTRLPYRQGRKLTAVKVYTINNESKHLLVFGVPSLNLRQETKSLFLKFGKLLQFNITKHPSEQFTETYHAVYEGIGSARLAKRMLDTKNFYGGILHVCYAPELETIDETRHKLTLRQNNVIARLKNLQNDVKTKVLDVQNVENENKTVVPLKDSNKLYMGDNNSISFGKRKAKDKKLVKRLKNTGNTSSIDIKNVEEEKNEFEIGTQNPDSFLSTVNFNVACDNNTIDEPTSLKYGTQTIDNKVNTDKEKDSIEVIDFTSTNIETLTNINEALNYNNFGRETIKKVPYKPVNKILFNLSKKT